MPTANARAPRSPTRDEEIGAAVDDFGLLAEFRRRVDHA